MAHFPASLSMSRLAGSSGTQKVCEATKSRNRTGSVISKSGRSGLSQMPAAMTQRGLKHQSERRQLKVSGGVPRGTGVRSLVLAMSLELIASGPPSRPRNGTPSSGCSGSVASFRWTKRSTLLAWRSWKA